MPNCPQCGGVLSSPSADAVCPVCLKRVALQESGKRDENTESDSVDGLLPETAQPQSGQKTGSSGGGIGSAGGLRWGDYELLEAIGHGAMGTVFKARHMRLNRTVALKRIRHGSGATEGERKRFLREAEAAARLQHPHI